MYSSSDSTETPLEASIGTNGSVIFTVDDLSKVKSPEYQVHVVDKNGREQNMNTTLKFLPVISTVMFGKCDQPAGTCTVTLQGNNLNLVQRITALCGSDQFTGNPDLKAETPPAQYFFGYSQVNEKTGCKILVRSATQDIDTGKSVDFKSSAQ